ncbi:MAG: hypothetical protein H7Z37_11680 [Pyrinomonadaceae bacterium]|nr:hypothetical protein [Pyrinomonadaceae bacterium]
MPENQNEPEVSLKEIDETAEISENEMAEQVAENDLTANDNAAAENSVETGENVVAQTENSADENIGQTENSEVAPESTETAEAAETVEPVEPVEPEEEEEITYHAVQKEDAVTAIWEMQGRKHLRTIDPRSREGEEILRLFTAEEGEESEEASEQVEEATA